MGDVAGPIQQSLAHWRTYPTPSRTMRFKTSLIRNLAVAVSLLSLLAACATQAGRTATARGRRPGHIYMFRGAIGPIASGVDGFSRELRAKGFDAHAYEGILGEIVGDKIERYYADPAKREPVVLVGYSTGAVIAVAIARSLNRLHIPVDLLVTLDPAVSEVVPPNVRTCLNYYERRIPGIGLLSGTLMRAGPGVELQNIRMNERNHFTIDKDPVMKTSVTAWIIDLSSTQHNPEPTTPGRVEARTTPSLRRSE